MRIRDEVRISGSILNDAFCNMPLASQALYFALCLYASDDGVVESPNMVAWAIGASAKDLYRLFDEGYLVYADDDWAAIIKCWPEQRKVD